MLFQNQCQTGNVLRVEKEQQHYQRTQKDISKFVNKQHPHCILKRIGTVLIKGNKKHGGKAQQFPSHKEEVGVRTENNKFYGQMEDEIEGKEFMIIRITVQVKEGKVAYDCNNDRRKGQKDKREGVPMHDE